MTPRKYSITSMGNQVASFGGVSLRGCTTLWNLNRFQTESPIKSPTEPWYIYAEPLHLLGWQSEVSGGYVTHFMSFHEPETAGGPDNISLSEASDTMKLRVVCHYLLDLIGDEGLPELFESMKDNYEF